jgi:hypothetical protein
VVFNSYTHGENSLGASQSGRHPRSRLTGLPDKWTHAPDGAVAVSPQYVLPPQRAPGIGDRWIPWLLCTFLSLRFRDNGCLLLMRLSFNVVHGLAGPPVITTINGGGYTNAVAISPGGDHLFAVGSVLTEVNLNTNLVIYTIAATDSLILR